MQESAGHAGSVLKSVLVELSEKLTCPFTGMPVLINPAVVKDAVNA